MRRTTVAAISALAVVLAACGQTEAELTPAATEEVEEPTATEAETSDEVEATEEGTSDPEDVETETAETTEAEETTEEEGAPEQESDGVASFGETYTFDDGLVVTIEDPEPYTPSEWAAGVEQHDQFVVFTVRVENGSDEPLDLSMAMMTAQSGTGEASEVFDSEQGLEGSPMTTILPGRTSEWQVGFGVTDLEDIVVEFAPSWDHQPVFYVT